MKSLNLNASLKHPHGVAFHELLNLGASSSQNLFQVLITNQDLLRLRLRKDMWPNHKILRKGWWCRAFATAINRQCPTCNRLWTTEQFPPSSRDFLHLNGVLVLRTVRERGRGGVQVWGWGVWGTYSSTVRVALPPPSRRPLSSSEGEEGRSCLKGN